MMMKLDDEHDRSSGRLCFCLAQATTMMNYHGTVYAMLCYATQAYSQTAFAIRSPKDDSLHLDEDSVYLTGEPRVAVAYRVLRQARTI